MPWIDLPPAKKSQYAGVLGDIDSRVPSNYPSYFDDDEVTFGHESSHGAAAWIRNEQRTANGFYCLNNRAYVCDSPPLTLRELANEIPANLRGQVYKLYLIDQQRHWNETPLYCLDECVAYANGCIVGLEFGRRQRTLDSLERALEMWGYVRVAQNMSRDRGYGQQADFDSFLDEFHRSGISYLLRETRLRGWQ